MPILDPLLQYNLLFHKQEKKTPRSRQFLSKYLKIASKNIYRTYDTTKAYLQFKNDFREEISFIKSHFNCKNIQLDENIVVPNFYQFLDELIKKEDKNSEIEGDYFTISSTNRKFYYFQPYIEYSSSHSWIFTKSSIAILSIRMNNAELKKSLSLINLEVDIMIASGFTLVLCVSGFENCSVDNALYLKKIICKNLFAELHINYDSICYQESFYNFLKELSNSYTKFDSYVYIYSQKIRSSNDQNDSSQILKCDILFKYLKTLPCFQTFIVNDSIEKSLKKCKIAKTEPFKLFQNGFISDTLNIMLCDVPLYDTDDDIQNSAPSDFVYLDSSKRLGRISKEDFLFWKKTRIQIEIMNSNNDTITKYIDFDDIHLVNLELYVNNPIYLGKVDSDEIKSIENIINKTQNKYENQKDVKFKKEFFLLLFKEKKISKILAYVLYAYKKYSKNFLFLHNQVYIAHKTIKFCIANESTKNNRGFVYQVPTGEGKSSIVILIAAVLALFGKKVHVVSSNIVLANRDYNDSYEFFKKLGLKSSALLHYNEMPNFADENSGISEFNYPETYFSQMEFDNPIQMNLIACDEYGKADIVFSTLINFEIYYLYMTEKYPSLSNSFYRNISLVIDEADLVLIDELTNGTIISKSMNSNSEEILSYVYEKRVKSKKISAEKIHSEIVKKWPECTDIKPKDIQVMFDEIDLVNEDKNFVNGRKYSIEYIRDSKNNEKEIVPFSFDHTGILERNKEFSGFIQQFIAIKERKKTKENIVFKDISMNYLYVSHPIYVGLYGNVCGLTGTIGNKTDKDIFKNHYHLETQKIPRSNPNRRYEFPIILCDNIKERNDQVVNEIIEFHKIGIPILAIFFNPNEIEVIKKRIESHKDFQSNKVEIGIYNGKNDKIKPDESAGKEGAISLGTNVCGRGTHIKVGDKPLHVIVTFYSSNARSMNQAFGRTSRQKNFGTFRVICLAKEFFIETKKIKVNDINNSLERLKTINDIQLEYINEFIQSRDWIFDCDVKSQKISHDDLKTMRDVDINVNRVNACKFKFPICMSIDTFLDIQSQKIFSLYNCPNCKFTWMLFQQYVREMILESWSIFMNKIERKYHLSNKKESYTNYVSRKKQKLMDKLLVYFPVDDEEKLGIVPTFMHIFNLVSNKYNNKILRIYNNLMPTDDTEEDMSTKKTKMSLIRLGFRPYSLIQKSGSKIYSLLFREPKTLYIEDPELKYIQRGSPYLSITQKIDNIFNLICNFFSKLIGDKIGFKFFLRRTLGGCEFGICYDFDLENDDDELKTIQNCLIDKDPLFIFSINVKSMVPFLAGVLIFFLLYIANIARQLATIIQQIPKISVKVIKKAVVQLGKFVAEKAFGELEDQVCDALCDYLKNVLDNQIAKIQFAKRNYYLLFKMLSELLVDNHVADFGEKIHEKFQDKIKINTSTTFGKIMDAGMQSIFKVGFLVILCAASFLINFQINKSIKYSRSKVAAEFTKDQDENKIRNYVANNEKIFDKEIPQP